MNFCGAGTTSSRSSTATAAPTRRASMCSRSPRACSIAQTPEETFVEHNDVRVHRNSPAGHVRAGLTDGSVSNVVLVTTFKCISANCGDSRELLIRATPSSSPSTTSRRSQTSTRGSAPSTASPTTRAGSTAGSPSRARWRRRLPAGDFSRPRRLLLRPRCRRHRRRRRVRRRLGRPHHPRGLRDRPDARDPPRTASPRSSATRALPATALTPSIVLCESFCKSFRQGRAARRPRSPLTASSAPPMFLCGFSQMVVVGFMHRFSISVMSCVVVRAGGPRTPWPARSS